MKVAVMQPYLFPYIGYFQLIQAVDAFVFFDDVQYIERGYVNRNRVDSGNGPHWLTLPVQSASRSLSIRERRYVDDSDVLWRFVNRVETIFRNAPRFSDVMPVIRRILEYPDRNVARFNANAVAQIAQLLGMTTPFHFSSEMPESTNARGQARVLEVCGTVGANTYVNAIGGTHLYTDEAFANRGLQLQFLRCDVPPTSSAGHLSILHDVMYHTPEHLTHLLQQYSLLTRDDACRLTRGAGL